MKPVENGIPKGTYKHIWEIPKNLFSKYLKRAKNMTHFVSLLGFAEGSTNRKLIRDTLEKYSLDSSHFNSRARIVTFTNSERSEARRISGIKLRKKYSHMRANLISQERWIIEDSLKSDRKAGLENNLDITFVKELIKDGCIYCGETKIKITADRIDNTKVIQRQT